MKKLPFSEKQEVYNFITSDRQKNEKIAVFLYALK